MTATQAREINDPVRFWINARYPGGSSGAQITFGRIEAARAAVSASSSRSGRRLGAPATSEPPQSFALLVPDGVAKVVATVAGAPGGRGPVRATARVHSNLALLIFTRATAVQLPRIRWYDRAGRRLPSPDTTH